MKQALPLVPFLGIAVGIDWMVSGGLFELLWGFVIWLNINGFIWMLFGVAILLLLFAWKISREKSSLAVALNEDSVVDGEEVVFDGFGGGDVTVSVLLGMFFGWQEFLAVLFLGLVIRVVFGLCLGIRELRAVNS